MWPVPDHAALQAEEELEHRRRKKLAKLLSDAAERWKETLYSTPWSKVVIATVAANVFALAFQQNVLLTIAMLWAGIQVLLEFKPSCCRTTGLLAFGLVMLAVAVAPGPGKRATPFFEMELCYRPGVGATASHGLYVLCAPSTSTTAAGPLEIEIAKGELDADRGYRPVLLMPSMAHASLVLSVVDATGRTLFLPTRLALAPEDVLLFDSPAEKLLLGPPDAPGANSSAVGGGGGGGGGNAVFAASSRRRNRRRLRGFMRLGGAGLGGLRSGGGFSRGTGGFFSPRRGVSQGPSVGGRGPVSAFGGAARAPGAVGRPGATYVQNTPFMGGGYHPAYGCALPRSHDGAELPAATTQVAATAFQS